MRADQISAAPFEFIRIIGCSIEKDVNVHGSAVVRGYIRPEKEQEYLMTACGQTEVRITASDEDGSSKLIYCGILEDMSIKYENGVCTMEIAVVPYTYLLDLNPKRRSFQVPSMTYQEVLDHVLGQYAQGHAIMNTGTGVVIGEPIVQYQETDWEFVKRLASHFNTVIVPSYTTTGPKLYLGLLEWPGTTSLHPTSYRARKMVSEYLSKEQNQVEGMIEDDSLLYIVEDPELHEIGEKVEFQKKPYYVARMEGRLDGHQLRNTYYLKTLAGFKTARYSNEKIIGASLDGMITAVRSDVVQVRLRTDEKGGTGKWFSFSTVYSSPDGSGWYCMPEPGDEIRLYFPTEKEKHAYVISAVHLPVSGGGTGSAGSKSNPGASRCDPSHKTIFTSSGKMVDLSGNGIILDSGNNMRIELSDSAGITITSPLGVTIRSGSTVDIASLNGKVEVAGSDSVSITQNDCKVEVASNNVIYHGANAKAQ